VIYDFMDDGQDRADRIVDAIRLHDVRVAVLNTRPEFSPPPDQLLFDRLARQFTHYKVLGWFVVLWRDDPGPAPAQ
jgi:hypothetical protein